MNKKRFASVIMGVALALLCLPVFAAANVRLACDAGTYTAPAGSEAKSDYQVGEIVIVDNAGVVQFAAKITGDPVTTYRGSGQSYARETRYPCVKVDPASVPERLRWPSRRR